jgi:hypothetical protein
MSDYTVTVTEVVNNITAEELRNVVTTTASEPNKIYVKIVSSIASSSGIVLSGTVEPTAATGANGNWYIYKVAATGEARLYGPKEEGTWPNTYITITGSNRHVHDQASAAATWTVTHTLGGRPSVTVVDSTGTVVVGDVSYNSDTQVTITFSAAFSGSAYLT